MADFHFHLAALSESTTPPALLCLTKTPINAIVASRGRNRTLNLSSFREHSAVLPSSPDRRGSGRTISEPDLSPSGIVRDASKGSLPKMPVCPVCVTTSSHFPHLSQMALHGYRSTATGLRSRSGRRPATGNPLRRLRVHPHCAAMSYRQKTLALTGPSRQRSSSATRGGAVGARRHQRPRLQEARTAILLIDPAAA